MFVDTAMQALAHTAADTSNSGGSELLGLDMKYVYGLLLMLLAAALVFAQVWETMHPAPVENEEAKKKVIAAADKVVEAANKADEAAQTLVTSRQLLTGSGGTAHLRAFQDMDSGGRALVSDLVAQGDGATQAAGEAKSKAAEAKAEATSGSSLFDIANTVAGKRPLIGGAFVLIVLGAWISDYISITFS
ncbi:MAG: hypothetical protein WBP61_12455 [Nocardioides sp.]